MQIFLFLTILTFTVAAFPVNAAVVPRIPQGAPRTYTPPVWMKTLTGAFLNTTTESVLLSMYLNSRDRATIIV
ncbi:hypothetical protein BC834DRAFT_969881 [Gloeopeniophorella convolvens]|nr:hypothetical protein BC834DRAFT_969881 [Gloeopeniophorella convolvens]